MVVATAAVFSFTYPPELAMMVFSDYQKQWILYYRRLGKSHEEIARRLTEEGHRATKVGVLKFLRRYEQTGRSPASSCVALMASRRLILYAKKMKCFKDDS